ncbi:UDP-glucose 4-epimerase [Pseudovirgaria hyperparasitica]|uniref:UDP-glucose 4-epimerase n=1 Tax=Pseudovirgaria hyperparasitica TaxID=470096 RepID=A0A6A6WA38_9PEZI|nr:UDP-glucose 4-epimerase [Pseudovirgaria hyperparasitica]KAF2758820.1 UDP-glucose 4-epimerase [Pseudovirgaria hyperparasitica]
MATYTLSGASSPARSLSSLSISSDGDVGTPDTQRSVIFDEDDAITDPLDVETDNRNYILVVGGLGYIGSHTTLELLKANYNVIVVDDLSNSYRDVLDRVSHLASVHFKACGLPMPALRFHNSDYRAPTMRALLSSYGSYMVADNSSGEQTLKQVSRITGVIHFAAFKSVEESIQKPLAYYMNNVCGMVDFLALLQEFGIQNFVFSSSATVYGEAANRGVPLKEEHMVLHTETYLNDSGFEQTQSPGSMGLTSPYGRSKYMCEAILADIAKADPSWKITALRYFNPVGCHSSGLLGEDPRQKPTNLIPVVATVLTGQRPVLSVFGTDWETSDGTAVRDFIHVQDLARGHIAALAASANGVVKEPYRAYNLGTGHGHSVREVVASLENASSRHIPVQEVGRRAGDVGSCVARVDRAERELSWKAEKTLADCAVDVWNFTKGRFGFSGELL